MRFILTLQSYDQVQVNFRTNFFQGRAPGILRKIAKVIAPYGVGQRRGALEGIWNTLKNSWGVQVLIIKYIAKKPSRHLVRDF